MKLMIPAWYVVHLDRDTVRREQLEALPSLAPTQLVWVQAVALPEHPALGCLRSHRSIIRDAKDRGDPFVAILEDDALYDETAVPDLQTFDPPHDWGMVYMGGQAVHFYDDGEPYRKAVVLTTHAYIVRATLFDVILDHLDKISAGVWPFMPIDQVYTSLIHVQQHTYIRHPTRVHQRAGFSSIQNTFVDYDFVLDTQEPIAPTAPGEGCASPGVTIVTPTRNRPAFLKYVALRCILDQTYAGPIEWIIVDEHDFGEKPPLRVVHEGLDIKHLVLSKERHSPPITIAQKRNLGAKMATYDIIVHHDDDDYYLPTSLDVRVQTLLASGAQCVGCLDMLTYDIYGETSQKLVQHTLFEATLTYFKRFWAVQPFEAKLALGEGYSLLAKRHAQCRALPVSFIMVAVQHGDNVTRELRAGGKNVALWDAFPVYLQQFYHTVRVTHIMKK